MKNEIFRILHPPDLRYCKIGLSCLITGLLLASCGQPLKSAPPEPGESTQIAESENRGQMLPITARATIAGETIQLEVAETPEQQMMGLMFRTSLPDDRGMLFPFESPQMAGFWMKNCKIPLDMIFLRDGVVRYIEVNAPPCTADPCPSYGPDVPVDGVIELRGGRALELGLQVGDRIPIQFLGDRP